MGFVDRFLDDGTRDVPGARKLDPALEAVLRNLRAVLSSREGFGHVDGDFGLGRFAADKGRDRVELLAREVLEKIERYEPRLTELHLSLAGRDAEGWLNLSLEAKLAGKERRILIGFHTMSGQVRVTSKDREAAP